MQFATGAGLVLAAGVLWSVQGVLIAWIESAGSWTVLFWRSLGMLPVLMLWIGPRRALDKVRAMGWAGVMGGLGLVFAFGGAITALQSTTVANAVLLFSASPFLAAVFGQVILGERVRPLTWGAIALAVVGIVIMVGGVGQIGGGTLFGTLAALASAAGFAGFTVALRWGRVVETVPAVLLGAVFAMAAGGVGALATGQGLGAPLQDIAISVGMGALTLTGGMYLYTLGSRVVPAAQATLLSLVEVLLAPVWAWVALGEGLSPNTALGGAVLMAAVGVNAALGLKNPAQSRA